MEADDLIGTLSVLCKNQQMDVVVVSGDRDLLQLADEHVLIRIPKTKRTGTVIENYTPAEVEALYGVNPREFIDVKALMGDSSDNIPGVPSIGEKTATALIGAYHSIENAYEHRSEIKPPRAAKALEEHYDHFVWQPSGWTVSCPFPAMRPGLAYCIRRPPTSCAKSWSLNRF